MASTVHAIYENGIFRPVEPVDLPDHTAVELQLRVLREEEPGQTPMPEGLARVYAILGERYDSGHTDTAAFRGEPQPHHFPPKS
jgi:predicted DNA-binding antitoxin AbrB/MazE fold protein